MRAVVLSTCLLVCLAPAVWAEDGPKGKKYAVLVGITEYDHANLSPLKYTENDVEELAALLKKPAAGFGDVRVLTVTRGGKDDKAKPTKANVEKALKEILAKAKRHDTVLVALAGHGVTLEVQDPDEKKPSKTYTYFCPLDAHFREASFSTGKAPGLILMPGLMKDLADCGAGTKLILVDACRNELKADSAARNFDSGEVNLPKGMAAMFSCKPGEKAWETSKLGKKGHGVFFHHVIKGLQGSAKNKKGEVTWGGLVEYVTESVSEEVPKLIQGGAKQTPHGAQNFFGTSPVVVGAPSPEEDAFRKGRDHYFGVGTSVNFQQAAEQFETAAKGGHDLAKVFLALMLYWGEGAKIDLTRAAHLVKAALPKLKELAEQDDPDAQNRLGIVYLLGLGVAADFKEAAKWQRRAVEQGYGPAMHSLGVLYSSGRGVKKDLEEAVSWYRKAAAADAVWGQYSLGWAYATGDGVAQDREEGFRWVRKAAERGVPHAQRRLGLMYLNGEGTQKNEAEAVKWLKKAVAGGDRDAAADLKKLGD
jgi:TPR repeat protein